MTGRRIFPLLIAMIALLVLVACGPATPPAEETVPPPVEEPTLEPTAEPSTAPPAEPTAVPPTATPQIVIGWSSHASTDPALSFEHPGEWFGPAELGVGEGEGLYVKDPEQDIGLVIRFWSASDPAQMLAAWGTDGVNVMFVLDIPAESITDGDPVTVSRMESGTKIVQGGGITARAAFFPHPDGTMEVMWYAPDDRWEEYQPVFDRILASIDVWIKYPSGTYGLQTMYLHDWQQPSEPWEGRGLWFHSLDGSAGLALRIQGAENPATLLAGWSPETLAGVGLNNCTAPVAGDRVRGLGGEWDAVTGGCTDAAGAEMFYIAAFIPNRDRVLEVIAYAPAASRDYMESIFSTMLALLVDIR